MKKSDFGITLGFLTSVSNENKTTFFLGIVMD